MQYRLTSSPDFIIRRLETTAEIDRFVHLNAQTFRPDEDIEIVAARRRRFLDEDPDFHPDQLRGAFMGNILLGGYIIRERLLCVGPARLQTGCIGGVVTHPDYRHQGVATALMQEAIAYAHANQLALLLLHGIPNFYSQFGFIDCLEDTPEHAIDRKLIAEQPTDNHNYTVHPAMLSDAPALLTLYQSHYSAYSASFAPTRTLQRQEHLLRNWFQENLPLLALDSHHEAQGYLMLSRRWDRLLAYEVAANDWPAALALLQYHSSLLDAEAESPDELRWMLPLDASAFYLLADHFPLHSQIYSQPNQGWMARPVHLPTLFQSLLTVWQGRWQSSISSWSGNIALNVGNYTCFIELGIAEIHLSEHPLPGTHMVHLGAQVFTQLLFGHRPITWASAQPGQHIPDELIPVLSTLFPTSTGCIAGSDYF